VKGRSIRRIGAALALLVLLAAAALAQQKLFVASEGAELKADKAAGSSTLAVVPLGEEVLVLGFESPWYRVRTSKGEGFMYRGRLSETAPAREVEGGGDLFGGGTLVSGIKADQADTARGIRGLSSETEAYANQRGTPAELRRALDAVLARKIDRPELEAFLKAGRLGEYAQ
jgi:hypothetical protein